MLGKEDEVVEESSGGGGGGGGGSGNDSVGGIGSVSGGRKVYSRSASWSSSHVPLPPLVPEREGVGGSGRRPVAFMPRSNSKGRSCLPPLNIARRSLDEWPRAGSDDVGEWSSTPCGRDLNNVERLKLDLSEIQRVPDRNGGLVKRDRIASFDKKCSKVAEHIFLGGDSVAKDKDILKQHKITHVLNCVGFVCPEYFKENFVYRTLWLQDSPSEDITSILYDVFDYFEDVREQGGRVFVHCCQGVSRSTSLVIAYRMWREGQSFDDAFQFVKAARAIADPNMGFACQLLQCQKRVHAIPLSPSSLLRLYRIAPHSSYDPLHLVPKMLNVPSPAFLDSRGAFIMHVPSTIFVWVGKKCEPLIERDARGAVCQIVRYEKAQGPIVVVKEGEEPTYFWDAFSSLLPLMDKSGDAMDIAKFFNVNPGERLVDSYSTDFEIIHKASVGGFVPPFGSFDTGHETHLPVRESSWSVLRRKFAIGNMKEFVSASKSSPSSVYPDSLFFGADNNSISNFSSKAVARSSTSSLISSSSLSPSFSSASSPDSMSSDFSISSKCYSDSLAASSSLKSYTHAFSSTLSTLSNLSLVPTKLSPHSISKSSDFIDVNFTSKSCSQSVLSPSKKSSLSIAERRGGTPKSLKLPIPSDESQCQDDAESIGDIVFDVKLKGLNKESCLQDSRSLCPNSEGDGIDCDETCKASQGNRSSKRKESESAHHNVNQQVVVLEWPSLEKVTRFNAGDMDSSRVYIFVASSSISGKNGDSVVYLWVGKAFRLDCRNLLEINKRRADLPDFVVKEVTNKVVSQMGLSKETRVKVVKQDEEPSDFVALLSSCSSGVGLGCGHVVQSF